MASSAADSAGSQPPACWRRADTKSSLFERNEWLGGKAAGCEATASASTWARPFVTIPSVLRRIFAEAGRRLEDYLELVRLDPQWRCFFEDGSVLDLNQDPDTMAQTLDQFAPGTHSGRGYRDFIALSQRLNRHLAAQLLLQTHRRIARHV